jgi:hypothetical protein
MRGAELCGAFRLAVGRDDETKMVNQGTDDRDFVRALSTATIDMPARISIPIDQDPSRKEIYQIISKGEDLEFVLVAFKAEATLKVCQNDCAYILRESDRVFIWFGKSQPREAMGIGLVVAVVFMQKMNVGRNVHVQIVKGGEKMSAAWEGPA